MDHLIGLEPEQVVATGRSPPERFRGHRVYHALFSQLRDGPHQRELALAGQGADDPGGWRAEDARLERSRACREGQGLRQRRRARNEEGIYNLLVSYRSGDMWAPRVEQTEALQLEARYFLDCVSSGQQPFNDGRAGLRVVRMLEASQKSLKRGGEPVSDRLESATYDACCPGGSRPA